MARRYHGPEAVKCPMHGYDQTACKAERAALRAACRANDKPWPPVPTGRGFNPPPHVMARPTLQSQSPVAWVNAAMRPAYLRLREAYMRETPSAIREHARAEAEAHAAYAARLAAIETPSEAEAC